MISETDAAWLAGFIDGEGHVGIHVTTPPYFSVTMHLKNTHEISVRRVAIHLTDLGVRCHVGHELRKRGRDNWNIQVTNNRDIIVLSEAISKYSVTKAVQWKLITEYARSRCARSSLQQKPLYTKRELKILEAFKTINQVWKEAL